MNTKNNNNWLSEQTVQIFIQHYYSLDWIREYVIELRFQNYQMNVQSYIEKENDLLFCLKSFLLLFPTAQGLATLNRIMSDLHNFKRSRVKGKTDYCDTARYLLYFREKADEAEKTKHYELARLWKILMTKRLRTPYAWSVYATARFEESKIMGYKKDMIYWNEMKNNSKISITASDNKNHNILLVMKYYERKSSHEECIKEYKSRSAKAAVKGDSELSALWNLAAEDMKKWSIPITYSFMVAYSREKAVHSLPQVSNMWRAASEYFYKVDTAIRYNINRSMVDGWATFADRLVSLAHLTMKMIKKLLFSAATSQERAMAVRTSPEIMFLWKRAVSHYEAMVRRMDFIISMKYESKIDVELLVIRSRITVIGYLHTDFATVLKLSVENAQNAAMFAKFITKLTEYGYIEAKSLDAEMSQYHQNIIRYFEVGEFLFCEQDGERWSEVTGISENFKYSAGDLNTSLRCLKHSCTFFLLCHPVLERLISYHENVIVHNCNLVNNAATGEREDFVHPNPQFAKSLETIASLRFSVNVAPVNGAMETAKKLFVDVVKAIDYEEEFQLHVQQGNQEMAQLYEKMRDYRIKSVGWRREQCEIRSQQKGWYPLAWKEPIKTIEQAENLVQSYFLEKERKKSNEKNTISTLTVLSEVERLEEIADCFAKAERCNISNLRWLYVQAAECLQKATGEMTTFYRSFSSQSIEAAILYEQGDTIKSEFDGKRAKLSMMIQEKREQPSHIERMKALLEIAQHPNMINPLLLQFWLDLVGLWECGMLRTIRNWNESANDIVPILNEWKEKYVFCSIQALRARLTDNERSFSAWEMVIKKLKRGIQLKEMELEESKAKDEKKEKWQSPYSEEGIRLKEEIEKALKEIENYNSQKQSTHAELLAQPSPKASRLLFSQLSSDSNHNNHSKMKGVPVPIPKPKPKQKPKPKPTPTPTPKLIASPKSVFRLKQADKK